MTGTVARPATADALDAMFARLRARAPLMARTTAAERRERLGRLRTAVAARRGELAEAVRADFGRPPAETELAEIHAVLAECRHAMRRVARWMRPVRAGMPLIMLGSSSRVVYQPRGVMLILGAWNYPIALVLNPLVGAIAAGNVAACKPSEKAPRVAAVLRAIIADACAADEVALVEGEADTARALLELPWDHICFTGSPQIGRLVMAAAAKHLSSVTLELGGKSPAIVDASADVRLAARRIALGKFMNAGQTCIAPDYVLVHRSRETEFLDALRASLAAFYGADEADRRRSPDLARMIDDAAFERVRGLMEATVTGGARFVAGGDTDAADRYIAPTVLADVGPDAPIMQEEIFGPVLPVMAYDALEDALRFIRGGTRPLAMYLFTADRAAADRIVAETSSGATVIGNVGLHWFHHGLPFGGVGTSGMGAYHGVHGFREFSHARPVVRQREPSLVGMFFPPYREGSLGSRVLRLLEWL